MNTLEILLANNIEEDAIPKKEIEIKRLSKRTGKPFIITIKAISSNEYADYQKRVIRTNDKGQVEEINIFEAKTSLLLKGIVEPDLKNTQLLEKFKSPTPKELVKKLFLAGEIESISEEILNLTGFGNDAVEEIKN